MRFKKTAVYMDDELYQKFLRLVNEKGILRSIFLYEIIKERIEQMYMEEFRKE